MSMVVDFGCGVSDKQLQVFPNERYPWCPDHVDMKEECQKCQRAYSLTEVMQGQGRTIPARDEAIKFSFRMITGDLHTRLFLPTANVAYIKNVMAQVAGAPVELIHESYILPDRTLAAKLPQTLTLVARADHGQVAARARLAAYELQAVMMEDSPALQRTAALGGNPFTAAVAELMSCTRRSEDECREALLKHKNVDAAAAVLLMEDEPAPPEDKSPLEPAAKRQRTGDALPAASG